MMLTIETLESLEHLLTSDQVTYKGSQFMHVGHLIQALQMERKMIETLMGHSQGAQLPDLGAKAVGDQIRAKIEEADANAAKMKRQ